jgi:hypothetical protein
MPFGQVNESCGWRCNPVGDYRSVENYNKDNKI